MRLMIALAALLALVDASVQAGPPRRSRMRSDSTVMTEKASPVQESQVTTSRYFDAGATTAATSKGADDALEEVNAERAKRGLKAFLPDPLLNKAALACAKQRASRSIHGHLPESDFHYLPEGAHATAAGCGALEPSWGWGSCCAYDNYTYAGAAWVMGNDGRRYMHLFVR